MLRRLVSSVHSPRLQSGCSKSACSHGIARVPLAPSRVLAVKPVGLMSAALRNRNGDSPMARARNSQDNDTASASIGAPPWIAWICSTTAWIASVIIRTL